MSAEFDPPEFDRHAERYDGGIDNSVKGMLGDADSFIAVKARGLMRHEPGLQSGDLSLLDFGCGAGDLMRVLAVMGARARFTGCDVSAGMLAEAGRRWPAGLGPAPGLESQQGARSPFADNQFDVVVISAVLHHVPPPERPAVYAELGRVLKPGGRLYVFEHNPRNPLVRYVIARTPIDANAILLDAGEVRQGLRDAGRYDLETEYLMFMPPGLAFLAPVDRALAWLPLGAQYAVMARKPS